MPDTDMTIGSRIKELRIARGMSIEDVSERSRISESTLAGIEDNRISPPLGTIISLAGAFEVSVGEFLGDSADSPFCIVRSDDRKTVSRFDSAEIPSCGYSYQSLGHKKKNRQMEPFLVTLTPAEASLVEPNEHIGEEIIFVLEGKIKVSLAEHTDILNPGDSIYYDSSLPHLLSCHGDEPATILAVIYAKEEMHIL
jgi:transcriptional regulator with XRE-family HTH domain